MRTHFRSACNLAPRLDRDEKVCGNDGASMFVEVERLVNVRIPADEFIDNTATVIKHGDPIHDTIMIEQGSEIPLLPGMRGA